MIDPDNTVLNTLDDTRPAKAKRNACDADVVRVASEFKVDVDAVPMPVPVPADHPLLADLTSALVNLGWPKRHAISHAKDTLVLQSDISISQAIKLAHKQQ